MRYAIALLLLLSCSCAAVRTQPAVITRADRCWTINNRSTAWGAVGVGAGALATGAATIGGTLESDADATLRRGLLFGGALFGALSLAAFYIRDSSTEIRADVCDDGDVSPAEFPETPYPTATSTVALNF